MRSTPTDRPTVRGATVAPVGNGADVSAETSPPLSLVVGVDPGDVTGLAVYDLGRGALVAVESLAFWTATARVHAEAAAVVAVVVEDPRALGLYSRHRTLGREQRDRAARSVGQIDRDVKLWAELCRRLGVRCVCVPPARRAKWTAEALASETGWTGRTSEHGRDAARMAWEWARSRPRASGAHVGRGGTVRT